MNCDESIERIIRNLHYIIIYCDYFYFLTAMLALVFALFKKQKVMFFFAFLFTLVVFDSAMNHGYHNMAWHIIDDISAVGGCIILVIYFIYIWHKYKKIPTWSVALVIILFLVTSLSFFLSQIAGFKLKSLGLKTPGYDPGYPLDPNRGIFGPVTAEESGEKDYKPYELQIMKFYFHTCFHIVSGLTTCMVIVWLGIYA